MSNDEYVGWKIAVNGVLRLLQNLRRFIRDLKNYFVL